MEPFSVPTPPADRLLGFREVNALVGSNCKTSHTARSLARRGLIRAVQLNERVVRFSEASVFAFINGPTKGAPPSVPTLNGRLLAACMRAFPPPAGPAGISDEHPHGQ